MSAVVAVAVGIPHRTLAEWTCRRSSETALTPAEGARPFAEWTRGTVRVRERAIVVHEALFHQLVVERTDGSRLTLAQLERVKQLFAGVDRYAYLIFPPAQERTPAGEVHLWVGVRRHAADLRERIHRRGFSLTPIFAAELAKEPMP